MATGPEHYREAESRLRMAWEDGREPENIAHLVAEAQVHATLALIAATVMHAVTQGDAVNYNHVEWAEWDSATKATSYAVVDRCKDCGVPRAGGRILHATSCLSG